MNRRAFLRGDWRPPCPVSADDAAAAWAVGDEGTPQLPPDFTPALLRLEGLRLGLPVDRMSKEALVYAVARALRAGTRAPAATETPQAQGGCNGL